MILLQLKRMPIIALYAMVDVPYVSTTGHVVHHRVSSHGGNRYSDFGWHVVEVWVEMEMEMKMKMKMKM